ncbi:hypothetical protein ABPG74_019168 [Tetrahymena malaccensis]
MDNLKSQELNYPQIPCNCQYQDTSQYINIQSTKEDEQNFHYQKNEQIEKFFKEFGDEFIQALGQLKKIILNNQNQIFEVSSNLLEYYKNISQLVDLKNIIIDKQSNKQQKSNKILKIITKNKEESTENTNKINNENQFKLKQNSNLDNILKLVSNQSNFCNEKYLESVKNELIKIQDSINMLNIEKDVYLDGKQQINFNQLSFNQIQHIEILCNQISKLNNEYIDQQKLNKYDKKILFEQLQPSSSLVLNYLAKFDFLNSQEKKDKIQEVIRNYPIFEIAQIVKQNPQQFQLEISTFNSSKQNNLKNQNYKHFFVGLVGQAHKDNKHMYENSFINSFTPDQIYGDTGVSKIVKGKCLRDVKYPDEYNQIEVTFCVKNKFFQVSDYPKKENINEINDNKLNLIDTNQEYFLGLGLFFLNDSITILDFQEIK